MSVRLAPAAISITTGQLLAVCGAAAAQGLLLRLCKPVGVDTKTRSLALVGCKNIRDIRKGLVGNRHTILFMAAHSCALGTKGAERLDLAGVYFQTSLRTGLPNASR